MPSIDSLWEQAAVVGVLAVWLYSGHKGWWFWSPGVKMIVKQITKERDDWRALAVTLLRKQGIDLPVGFENATVNPLSVLVPPKGKRKKGSG